MSDQFYGITDYAKDAVLSLLQEFFSVEKNAGPFLFNRDANLTKILIADKYTINLEDVEKKPSIVVMRGAQAWGRRGIDQFLGWEGKNVGERRTDLVQGAFNCTCMSRQGLEAENIGHMVFAFFTYFKSVLRDSVKGIHDIQGVVLGEEMIAKSDSDVEVSVVPVQLSLLLQWSWLLEQKGRPEFHGVTINPSYKNGETVTKFLRTAKPALVG
jgi:hypothetical protein